VCACMCACVCPGRGFEGRISVGSVRVTEEAWLHSRFKGVAGSFQTGTMPTVGREVNWKSMGASVDRSDLGLWAIIWLANTRSREREFRACSRPNGWIIQQTHTFSPRGNNCSIPVMRVERRKKVGLQRHDTPLHNERGCHVRER
jgi:hypothetical protein